MSTAVAIKIHSSRGEQLRRIAAARGFPSVVGAIEHFIAAEIKAGTIPDTLPGFEAEREGNRVLVTIEGQALPALTPEGAAGLADMIVHLATSRGRDAGMGMPMKAGGKLDVARKGTGILIRITDTEGNIGETATLTFTMAADFCRSLHAAALSAQYDA